VPPCEAVADFTVALFLALAGVLVDIGNLPFLKPGPVLGRTGLFIPILHFRFWYCGDHARKLLKAVPGSTVLVKSRNTLYQARPHGFAFMRGAHGEVVVA